MLQCLKCQTKFPIWAKINGKSHNLSNRKFCLSCSPFKSHNTIDLTKQSKTTHWCPKCQKELPLTMFYSRRGGDPSTYCKTHTNSQTIERNREFKKQCVDYKGGKCQKCGYDKSNAALQFHHREPKQKEVSISRLKNHSFTNAKKELDKCDLLCANCHAETHELVALQGFKP